MHSDPQAEIPLADQIEDLRQQLRDVQRMAALGELLGTTTHEFNNVLMSVINYAKMGLRHKDEATRTKSLEKILAAGERAAKISKTILAAARNRSPSPEPTDLCELTQDAMLLLEREMRRFGVSVETEIQPAPKALAVGNQIQQVLINLLTNARQAMPDGGRILVRLTYDAAAGTVDLLVRDFGAGIPADKLPKIFDRYYSTKSGPDASGKGGTGLGLATCREIIEAHHGRIRVESAPGKGTAFTIKLPVAPTPAFPATAISAAAAAQPSTPTQ
ncbi:MAG: sensor histidine kinase [Planctomycetales bacterium]|nr:sensor histidine kinase [Planctomycetales bacterium]